MIRSLGGTAPFRPNTDAGTTAGTATNAAVRLRKARRDTLDGFSDMAGSSQIQ
jgi:hypothetical protein